MGEAIDIPEKDNSEEDKDKGSKRFSRRHFLAVAGVAGASFLIGSSLAGCSGPSGSGSDSAGTSGSDEIDYTDWNAVLEAAKGQNVKWYGWGGSEPRNTWISTIVAPSIKEKYDVGLEYIPMDAVDFVTKLSGEMQAGIEEGTMDFLWVNGENFYSTKANGYLWGPFCDYLPNFRSYVDADDPEIAYDFGVAVEGYEAPYGKAQMQMWVDSSKVADTPKNPDEFLAFCKANQGMVTYPEPGDFTGTAFICCLIAGVVGKQGFEKLAQMSSPTKESVKAIVEPGLAYLRELNPYLWKEGRTFPSTSMAVGTMYADGELIMNMGYDAPEADVRSGLLPETTRSFVFDSGTVGNTNFMAIPANAPNKAGAMVCINEILSPELQLTQYSELSAISVLDFEKLSESQRKAFEDVPLGATQLPLDEMLGHRVAEPAGPAIPLLEQIWLEEVVGK